MARDEKRTSCRIGCGESRKKPGRWRCKFGTTIRRRWPKSAPKLAHEFQVSVVDINFGCPVKQVTERRTAAPICCAYPERVGNHRPARRRGLRARHR